jgi:hypothetical protein
LVTYYSEKISETSADLGAAFCNWFRMNAERFAGQLPGMHPERLRFVLLLL